MTDITEAEARELGQLARIGHVRLVIDSSEDVDGLWWTDTHVWERIGRSSGAAIYPIKVNADDDTLTTGDGKFIFVATPTDAIDGLSLTDISVYVTTVSSSATPTFQFRDVGAAVDLLSTPVTIAVGEYYGNNGVIDTAVSTITTGHRYSLDCDVAGTGAMGLGFVLRFE